MSQKSTSKISSNPFYFSQNHRMVEVGRVLWRSPCLTPLFKWGPLQTVGQDHVQMAFEYLQGGRLHHLSGQPVPVLSLPYSERSVSWCSDGTSYVSVFIAFGPVTGHYWKEPGSIFFTPFLPIFIFIDEWVFFSVG